MGCEGKLVTGTGAASARMYVATRLVLGVAVLVAATLQSAAASETRGLWTANQWPGGRQWTEAEMDGIPSEIMTVTGIEPAFRVRVYKNEMVSNAAREQGFFGPLHLVKALLSDSKNGLVVDVGAHLGFVSLYAAALGHNVLAFEPHAPDYRMALASVRANPELAPRIGLYQAAVHQDAPVRARLTSGYVHNNGVPVSGSATLAKVSGGKGLERTIVDTVTLDAMVPEGRTVDVLKIDVTGCQCHVLRSAAELFEAGRIRSMLLVVSLANKCGCKHEDDVDWLLGHGMRASVIDNGELVGASREHLLATKKHKMQVWVSSKAVEEVEAELGTDAASTTPSSTTPGRQGVAKDVCEVDTSANATALSLFVTRAKKLAAAGDQADEALAITDAMVSCHPRAWQAAVAAAITCRLLHGAGQSERAITGLQAYLQSTEDHVPSMLTACKRSTCLHHVTVNLRARAGCLLALADALAATGQGAEAVAAADAAVARDPSVHTYEAANKHRRSQGLEPLADPLPASEIAPASASPAPVPRPRCTSEVGGRYRNPERDGCVEPGTLTLVLTVFKRDNLQVQLEAALKQTLRPTEIIVWHDGDFVDVSPILAWYRAQPGYGTEAVPPLSYIHSSRNFKYLGRFLPLAALGTEYTSVWDDDVLPQRKWLAVAVATSQANSGAVVGPIGRRFSGVSPMGRVYQDRVGDGGKAQEHAEFVDFLGHAWVMPTENIRTVMGADTAFLTFATAEDAQLGFALQRHGIRSVVPAQLAESETFVHDHNAMEHASMSDSAAQFVRHRTFCEMLLAGFKPLACDGTCADAERLASCVRSNTVGNEWYSQARDLVAA